MNIEFDERSFADEAAETLKPIDDLLAKEAEEMRKADEMIQDAERKSKKVIREAKRDDQE
jgi:hypothetical protein